MTVSSGGNSSDQRAGRSARCRAPRPCTRRRCQLARRRPENLRWCRFRVPAAVPPPRGSVPKRTEAATSRLLATSPRITAGLAERSRDYLVERRRWVHARAAVNPEVRTLLLLRTRREPHRPTTCLRITNACPSGPGELIERTLPRANGKCRDPRRERNRRVRNSTPMSHPTQAIIWPASPRIIKARGSDSGANLLVATNRASNGVLTGDRALEIGRRRRARRRPFLCPGDKLISRPRAWTVSSSSGRSSLAQRASD